METESTFQTGTPVPNPVRARRIFLWLLVGAALIIAIAAWFAWNRYRAQPFPPELERAFFLTPAPQSAAYREVAGKLVSVSPVGSTVLEATLGRSKTVLLLENKEGRQSLTVDGHEVFATTTPVADLSLSPDETKAALSLRTNASLATTSEWRVTIVSLATGTTEDVGAGRSPIFLGDAHLMYFVPYGIRMHDLGNGSDYAALLFPFKDNQVETLASPDRKTMGWHIGNGPVGLFAVTHVAPVALRYEGIGSTTPNASYTLGNGALYEIRQHAGASEVWKRASVNEKPVKMYVFPKGILIERIAF